MPRRFVSRALMLLLLSAAPLPAEEQTGAQLEQTIEADSPQVSRDGDLVLTQHEATIGGEAVRYTATAGTLPLKNDEGKVRANVFFIAYTRDGVDDLGRRPVTFCFNGGPGSSSVWLHMGLLGPKRVRLAPAPEFTPPPHGVVDNPHSLLGRTDLVFIDPVSTGYSRPAEGEKKEQFHGYQEDIESVGAFVHLYTTRYGRWNSPRFLMGESYGGLRAAGLANHMLDRYYMVFNGVVLVSAVLDFRTIAEDRGNDLPYVLFLPSFTATAWHHKRLPGDLQERALPDLLEEVEQFALGEYTAALAQGAALPEAKREAVAEKLARYTGLTTDYVERSNLRIAMSRFAKELLREQERTVGRFDSRYVGIDRDAAGSVVEYDPSASAVFPPFTAAFYAYVRNDLKFVRDEPYEILTGKVHPWSYERFQNRYVDASDALREVMTQSPYLRLFVATGECDLATPYLGMQYSVDHLALDPGLRRNITVSRYAGGHMMYTHEPSLERMKLDLDRFYREALPAQDAAQADAEGTP